MAQRSPRNDRYMTDRPAGKTKKSASSAKPVKHAASSVRIKGKPSTKKEKQVARKKREREQEAKDVVRAQKVREKEKAALLAAGVELDKPIRPRPVKPTRTSNALGKFNETKFIKWFFGEGAERQFFKPDPLAKANPTYKRYKYTYWIMLLLGIALLLSLTLLVTPVTDPDDPNKIANFFPWYAWCVLGLAFAMVIFAIFFDRRKIQPIKREYHNHEIVKKSPKQLKRETEAKKHAYELAAAREVERAARSEARRERLRRSGRIEAGDAQLSEVELADAEPENAEQLLAIQDEVA